MGLLSNRKQKIRFKQVTYQAIKRPFLYVNAQKFLKVNFKIFPLIYKTLTCSYLII